MALNYTNFLQFPLQIVGINSDYNSKITAIENFVVSDLAYSGLAGDITAILPYFVFWYFCQDAITTAAVESGENLQVKEFSEPAMDKQIQNWNTGVKMLRAVFGITDELLASMSGLTNAEKMHSIVEATGKTVNEKYLSKRNLL